MASKYDAILTLVLELYEKTDPQPIKIKIVSTQLSSLRRALKKGIQEQREMLHQFDVPSDHIKDVTLSTTPIEGDNVNCIVSITINSPDDMGFTIIE